MIDKKKLGWVIRQIRKSNGHSLQRFADLIGISKTHMFDLEKGRSMPSVNVVYEVFRHTENDMQKILDDCYEIVV